MFKSFYNGILEWNNSTNERQKLQHTYFALAVLSVIVAGLVSLVDAETGRELLVITLGLGVILVVNAVLWSLVESGLIARLSGRRRR